MSYISEIISKTSRLGLVAASAVFIAGTPASANDQICKKYAGDAVDIFHKARVLSCGFKSPVWDGNSKHHYDWCMQGNNAATVAVHTANRAAQLASCKAKKGNVSKVENCRIYALDAVAANREAAKLGCGFKPPIWSNNHQKHHDWCMHGANSASAAVHTANRTAALAKCKASKAKVPPPQKGKIPGKGKLAVCDLYANEALKLAAKASARGCGFSGPRWIQSYQTHYKFCLSDPGPVILLAEANARNSEYKSCKAKAKQTAPAGSVPVWVFRDSNKRRLEHADLAPLGKARLWQARNEIIARKGYIFKSAKARRFFAQMPWYQPVKKTVTVNSIERANIALIKSYE